MKIKRVHARQILDSRGNPTVEADVILEDGSLGRAAVPSGASTGVNEALELRDKDSRVYQGLGVLKAVENVNTEIAGVLNGTDVEQQDEIDQKMISLDGTENKSRLGANAVLAVSLAASKAAANQQKIPLFEYFHKLSGNHEALVLPLPMMNIINGGKHADESTDIQEFMVMPVGASSFSEALRMGSEVFHNLGKVMHEKGKMLHERGYAITVGDEGGYAPEVKNGNAEALDLISQAVERAGYKLGQDILLALDVAASEFAKGGGIYQLKVEKKNFNSDQMIDWLANLKEAYQIASIEDGLSQEDWKSWRKLTERIGGNTQLVGDDLLATNTKLLQRAISEKSCNSILVKPNQIGTLSETIQAVKMAKEAGWNTIISHRSGETEDTTIAHLAVGLATGQIKTGSLSRTDRVAKYNELLRIVEVLGARAVYAGRGALKNNA